MNRNNGIIVLVILLLLAAGAIWFLFFRKPPVEEAPPPVAATQTSTTVKKPAPLPLLVEQQEFYDTKELRARYIVYRERPEVKHGKYQEFYPSQAKKLLCEYVENVVQGPVQYFYENGKEAMTGSFKDGLRVGAFVEFHPSGNLKNEATYVAGKLDGPYREYYDTPDKAVMFEKTYAAGVLAAAVTVRKPDGSVKYTVAPGDAEPVDDTPAAVPTTATPAPAPASAAAPLPQ
jgi:hypothetical protein